MKFKRKCKSFSKKKKRAYLLNFNSWSRKVHKHNLVEEIIKSEF